jgi:hypothetical protein
MIFVLLASAAFCETYTWEDQNGINFTDDLAKVPKKYRSKAIAEARKDITGSDTPVTTSDQSSSNQPAFHQPSQETSLRDDKNSDGRKSHQELPRNIDEANDELKYQDSYQSQERYENHRHHYSGQSPGVEEAQRSACESQSQARKDMNRMEERIWQSRQVLDAGGSLPTKQEHQQKGGKAHKTRGKKNVD